VQTGWHSAILIHYGVQSDTSNRIYFVMTGNNEHAEQALSVYPVPNNGRFFISAPVKTETICTLTVYNTAGIEVFETDFLRLSPATEKSVDLGPLPNGVYTVVIRNNDWQSVRKIVINR
jgi:hypothetical protein